MWIEFNNELINLNHVTRIKKKLHADYSFIELWLLNEKVSMERYLTEHEMDERYHEFASLLLQEDINVVIPACTL